MTSMVATAPQPSGNPTAPVGATTRTIPISTAPTTKAAEHNVLIDNDDENATRASTPLLCPPLSPSPPPLRPSRGIVSFNEAVRVRHIPTRLDMILDGTLEDTVWTPEDFAAFRRDFATRAQAAGVVCGNGSYSSARTGVRTGVCMLRVGIEALMLTVGPEDEENAGGAGATGVHRAHGDVSVDDRKCPTVGGDDACGVSERGTRGSASPGIDESSNHDSRNEGYEEGASGDGGEIASSQDTHMSGADDADTPQAVAAAGSSLEWARQEPKRPWFLRNACCAGGDKAAMVLLPVSSIEQSKEKTRQGREQEDVDVFSVFVDVLRWFVMPWARQQQAPLKDGGGDVKVCGGKDKEDEVCVIVL